MVKWGGVIFHTITHLCRIFIAFQAIEGTQFSKFFPGGACPRPPLADECLDIQPPSPENTPRPSFDMKTVSCNTSENLRFVKRKKQFLVASHPSPSSPNRHDILPLSYLKPDYLRHPLSSSPCPSIPPPCPSPPLPPPPITPPPLPPSPSLLNRFTSAMDIVQTNNRHSFHRNRATR